MNGAAFLVHGARLVGTRDSRPFDAEDGWMLVRDGRIAQLGTGTPPAITNAARIDTAGATLTPGLIDVHNHGGGGFSFDGGPEAIRGALAAHAADGVTRVVASLVSAREELLAAQLREVAQVANTEDGLLGAHLEGPCLHPAHRGAHDPEALRTADPALLAGFVDSGVVRQVTLAPELPGASEAITQLREAGIVVAVGHTDADRSQAQAAFDAGARLLTHAFNAMRGLHHRDIGPVGAALDDPHVFLEVIADGHHLDPVTVRMLFGAAPGRIVLISDAMAAAGAGDGSYRLGALDVEVTLGRATLAGTDTIAGSTLTLGQALRNAVGWGIPLADAVHAATHAPAQALGLRDLGCLDPGAHADLVLWSDGFEALRVWRSGMLVHSGATEDA